MAPWLIFRAWIATDQFCWIRFHWGDKRNRRWREGRGGGDYSREAIDRGTAIIRGNTVFLFRQAQLLITPIWEFFFNCDVVTFICQISFSELSVIWLLFAWSVRTAQVICSPHVSSTSFPSSLSYLGARYCVIIVFYEGKKKRATGFYRIKCHYFSVHYQTVNKYLD